MNINFNPGGVDIDAKVIFYGFGDDEYAKLVRELKGTRLNVLRSQDPEAAKHQLKEWDIELIIFPFLKEDMIQNTLMKYIRKKYADTARIALGSAEDRQEMAGSLLKGTITSYFETDAAFTPVVNGILHQLYAKRMLKEQKLQRMISSLGPLPVFPESYQQFIDALEQDKPLKALSSIIERDVAIATEVLKIANSDILRGSRIGSIERAAIYLGLDTVKNIVFTVSLAQSVRLGSLQKRAMDDIITHSVQVNQKFHLLYEKNKRGRVPEQYSTIGITHDIGKIVMLQKDPERYFKIVKYKESNPEISFYRSEIELGYEGETHAEIGAYLLNLWHFPEASVFAALFHHSTEEFSEPYREILNIFALVNDLVS